MSAYEGLSAFYGDIHNHCGISYGHGTLEDALNNARERLDFCSVTGHANWPDMPKPTKNTQPIIDFHVKGFARLKQGWDDVKRIMESFNQDGNFLTFLGFEVHSREHGDYTVVYKDYEGDLLYEDIPGLKEKLRELNAMGHDAIMFPHHIGYRKGSRGINWDSFTAEHSPIVEIISMHGCSESDGSPRQFLGAMGASDWEGTMQSGLEKGKVFGVVGNTDHHYAHPGSYGHGLTGIWAKDLSRDTLWQALRDRRTYALTGDRIDVRFDMNGHLMGSEIASEPSRTIQLYVSGGCELDYVDIIKNNQIIKRFISGGGTNYSLDNIVKTKLYLELGWGFKHEQVPYEIDFGISNGEILSIEPRFRGDIVVSPLDVNQHPSTCYHSHWEAINNRMISFKTNLQANGNYFASKTQGMCIEVESSRTADIIVKINQKERKIALKRLLQGSVAGDIDDEMESHCWKLHKAPLPWQYQWELNFEDRPEDVGGRDVYYVRVRQTNDQWAWSSSIFVG